MELGVEERFTYSNLKDKYSSKQRFLEEFCFTFSFSFASCMSSSDHVWSIILRNYASGLFTGILFQIDKYEAKSLKILNVFLKEV